MSILSLKRFSSVCAALALLFASTPVHALFFDVPDDYPYVDAIDYLTRVGVLGGYENRSFRPDIAINRAEFTKIVVTMLFTKEEIDTCIPKDVLDEEDPIIPTMDFPDVPMEGWYARFVCTAWRNGIVNGYPDGTFRPEEGINFAEAAKMLSIAFGFTGVELPNFGSSLNAQWYRPYAEYLEAANAIPPSITRYDFPVTRGEMAEMLYRLKEMIFTQEPVPSYSLTTDDIGPAVDWTEYTNKAYGFSLLTPNVWPRPHTVARGTFDGRIPYMRSLWTVYIGPERADCGLYNSCVERDIWIDGYPTTLASAILEQIERDEFSVEILEQNDINGMKTLSLMEQVGDCIDKRIFFFGDKYIYVFNALCASGNEKTSHMMDRLAQGFLEIIVPSLEY